MKKGITGLRKSAFGGATPSRRASRFLTPGVIILACFLLPPPPLRAGERRMIQGSDVTIVFDASLGAAAGDLSRNFHQSREEVEELFGWKLGLNPTVLLTADRALFERMNGGRFGVAFAVPREHAVVLYESPGAYRLSVSTETLKHELCHLALHDHIAPEALPKWLDEGTCQWVSGSLGEMLSEGALADSGEMRPSDRPIPLRNLASSFPTREDFLFLAYRESRSFVEFLGSIRGKDGVLDLLRFLSMGDGLDAAFIKSFGESPDNIETRWIESLRQRHVWMASLAIYMDQIIFLACTVLTLLACVKVLIKRKRYPETDEEGAESEVGAAGVEGAEGEEVKGDPDE
jgi:hypothetical protein